ncbi:hypothetical protein CRENBAI_025083 [Crenichthys baileyi]|uniref:Ig-like domain-containing protein n=1 Tax=Crenichthys baileyi TaxID=28760 RepID=A0AAV9R1H2_9TELE
MLVSSGDPVTFTCNISENATVLIHWTSGRYYFTYSRSLNQTKSNFSSERVKIDSNIPSKLCIFRAQHDDAGLYTCTITDGGGYNKFTWDLTVSEQEGICFSKYIFFILSPAIGLLLCCITVAFCLCRNCGRRSECQGSVHNQYQYPRSQSIQQDCDSVFTPQTVPTNLPDSPNCRRSKQQRNDYIERRNSIYALL